MVSQVGCSEASAMAQSVKLPPVMPESPMGVDLCPDFSTADPSAYECA